MHCRCPSQRPCSDFLRPPPRVNSAPTRHVLIPYSDSLESATLNFIKFPLNSGCTQFSRLLFPPRLLGGFRHFCDLSLLLLVHPTNRQNGTCIPRPSLKLLRGALERDRRLIMIAPQEGQDRKRPSRLSWTSGPGR